MADISLIVYQALGSHDQRFPLASLSGVTVSALRTLASQGEQAGVPASHRIFLVWHRLHAFLQVDDQDHAVRR